MFLTISRPLCDFMLKNIQLRCRAYPPPLDLIPRFSQSIKNQSKINQTSTKTQSTMNQTSAAHIRHRLISSHDFLNQSKINQKSIKRPLKLNQQWIKHQSTNIKSYCKSINNESKSYQKTWKGLWKSIKNQ